MVCAGAIAAARQHVRAEQMMDEPNLEVRSDRDISTVVFDAGAASSFSEFIVERGRFLPHKPGKTRYVYEA